MRYNVAKGEDNMVNTKNTKNDGNYNINGEKRKVSLC